MIPKIIHYCWFGKNPLNKLAKKCIKSWKKYCPDYEIIEWNEDNFDINCNQYVKEAYESKKWAFVTDYVRLYALDKCGGVYMDTDVELLKGIDEFLVHNAFSGFETPNTIPTAIMGSVKGGEWIKHLLTYYDDRRFILPDGKLDITTNVTTITNMTEEKYGVKLNNEFQNINDVLVLYPKDYFCPKDYRTGQITLTDNTTCIHHFNASWHSEEERKRHERYVRYLRVFGKKNAYRIIFVIDALKQFKFGRLCGAVFAFIGGKFALRNTIVLKGQSEFDGNAKALSDYLINNGYTKKYKIVWIVENRKNYKRNQRKKVVFCDEKSLLYAYYLRTSKYLIWENVPIKRKDVPMQKNIYLSHGFPMKNLKGLIDVDAYCTHILCPSTAMKRIYIDCFNAPTQELVVGNQPKLDLMFENNVDLSKLGIHNNYDKIILWMPTFRKADNSDRNDSDRDYEFGIPLIDSQNVEQLNQLLKDKNILLMIKLHPHQELSVIKLKENENIKIFTHKDILKSKLDLYKIISKADALLTDYSSVSIDYLLLDRPIGYSLDDIEDYNIGFAFENVMDYMPGHHMKTFDEMIAFFEDITKSKDLYKDERRRLKEIIYENTTGNSIENFLAKCNIYK